MFFELSAEERKHNMMVIDRNCGKLVECVH